MTATLHTFPQHRVVRLTDWPRMTEGDLAHLRHRWANGRHETATFDGVTFDQWLIPSIDSDADGLPVLLIVLQHDGSWTLGDDTGRMIKVASTVEAL